MQPEFNILYHMTCYVCEYVVFKNMQVYRILWSLETHAVVCVTVMLQCSN